jgi:hypothetical protein
VNKFEISIPNIFVMPAQNSRWIAFFNDSSTRGFGYEADTIELAVGKLMMAGAPAPNNAFARRDLVIVLKGYVDPGNPTKHSNPPLDAADWEMVEDESTGNWHYVRKSS